jgi:hypothetical protein
MDAPRTVSLHPIMRQGVGSTVVEADRHFDTVEAARHAARHMFRDDRVLRAYIVADEEPPRFIEWVER